MKVVIYKTDPYGSVTEEIEEKGLLINIVVINNVACAAVALDSGNLTIADAKKVKVLNESGTTRVGSSARGDDNTRGDGRPNQESKKS